MVNGAGAIGAISAAFVLTGEIFDPDSKVMALQVAQGIAYFLLNFHVTLYRSNLNMHYVIIQIELASCKHCLVLVRLF